MQAMEVIVGKGLADKLYEGEAIGDNPRLRVFQDLVTLATAPFIEDVEELTILDRIPVFDKIFLDAIKGITGTGPFSKTEPMASYIATATDLAHPERAEDLSGYFPELKKKRR
tara:strand:+ start:174 stop:512 length:339 start_codon:yes stop_codon:yes gene_type:complete